MRQLRYFAVLGDELNYRRAAEKLFISQPALSTAIKQLEHQFGIALFRRNTREVALTDLGAAWLPQVQQALGGIDVQLTRRADLIAPSIRPKYSRLVSVPAQWTRPCGVVSAGPSRSQSPGPNSAA